MKRWSKLSWADAVLVEAPDGEYVLYEEAAAIIAEMGAKNRDPTIKHDVACSTISLLQGNCDARGKALKAQCDETKSFQEQLRTSNEARDYWKAKVDILRYDLDASNEQLVAAQARIEQLQVFHKSIMGHRSKSFGSWLIIQDGWLMGQHEKCKSAYADNLTALAENNKEVAAKHETRVSELSGEILELRSILGRG